MFGLLTDAKTLTICEVDGKMDRWWTDRIAALCNSVVACLKVMKMDFWPREVEPVIKPESPTRGLTVIAASMHHFANFRSPKAP